MIPERWKTFRLGEIAEIQNGFAFKSEDFSNKGIPIIKIKNIVPPNISLDYSDYYEGQITNKLKPFLIIKDDILISMTGSHLNQISSAVGKVGKYRYDFPALLNQRVGKLFSKDRTKLNEDILYYFISRSETQIELVSSAGGSANQANISPDQIKQLEITIPIDIYEQSHIAAILSSLDDKIELNLQMNKTLEAIAQAIFKEWFVDFRFPGFDGELVDGLPKGWRKGKLVEDFRLIMGQSPPGVSYNEIGEGTVFYQGRTDFGFRFPENRMFTTLPNRMATKLDTLVSVRAPVGDINMALEDCCIGRGLASVRHITGAFSYTYYAIKSLENIFKGFEGEGTVFGSINKLNFENISIVMPVKEVIEEFEKLINPLDEKILNNSNEIKMLTTLRDVLLPRLMTGKIRVA